MLLAHAELTTATPERFIRQLVSHLGHKLTTELRPDGVGVVAVPGGRCVLTAREGVLVLDATADGSESLAHVQDVVARHLERFGARAELRVSWGPTTTDS
jgi:caffeoyl-CoA O-methyltransferase